MPWSSVPICLPGTFSLSKSYHVAQPISDHLTDEDFLSIVTYACFSLCWPWVPNIVCFSNFLTLKACPRSYAWFVTSVTLQMVYNHWLSESTSPFFFSLKETPVTRWHHFYHTSRRRTPVFCRNRRITHLSCQLHRFQRDSHCNLSLRSCRGHCLSIVSRKGIYFTPKNNKNMEIGCSLQGNLILLIHFNIY